MQQPQLIVHGLEGRPAEQLHRLAQADRVWLREIRQLPACLAALRTTQGQATVLVLRLGRDIDRELALLAHVHEHFPATATIVVGDTANPALAGLAWDLGAWAVLFPPLLVDLLPDLVRKFLAPG